MKWAKDMSIEEILAELDSLCKQWDEFREDVAEEGMAGSPGEWMWERMSELTHELKRRTK